VQDAFVAKLSPSGSSLVYSTYLGGSDTDTGSAIAVDASGSAYVAGSTFSLDFPTARPLQAASKLAGDAFVAKLDPAGSTLVYSTYLGGTLVDLASAIAVDGTGAAWVTGSTTSTDFPTVHPRQSSYGGGTDAFVSKIAPDGSSLLYSTYFGGSGTDQGNGIAVDCQGNVYVTGETISTNFPTASPFQSALKGTEDAFVAKFDETGGSLVFSTYLGGGTAAPNSALNQQGITRGLGIAVDAGGSVTVVGTTSAVDFPVTNAYQSAFAGGPEDAFAAQFAPSGSSLSYGTYLGGTFDDFAAAVALDPSGNVYLFGTTSSADFPTADPLQSAPGGGDDAFVVKIPAAACTTTATPAISSPATVIAGQPYVLTWTATLTGAGQYVVTTLLDGVIVQSTTVSTSSMNVATSADNVGHTLTFLVQAVPGCGAGCSSGVAVKNVSLTQAACASGPATLCLDDQPGDARFQVQVAFQTVQGGGLSGSGQAIPLAGLGVTHGGVLWFFSADNPEVLIKVLPACSASGFHWVFASAGTNVGVTITVIDTRTGARRAYVNADLHPMAPIQDTGAFACP
jgi:Beta-propeller repeat